MSRQAQLALIIAALLALIGLGIGIQVHGESFESKVERNMIELGLDHAIVRARVAFDYQNKETFEDFYEGIMGLVISKAHQWFGEEIEEWRYPVLYEHGANLAWITAASIVANHGSHWARDEVFKFIEMECFDYFSWHDDGEAMFQYITVLLEENNYEESVPPGYVIMEWIYEAADAITIYLEMGEEDPR